MPKIEFDCSDEDAAWIKSQAEELGIDDVGMTVRVIVRDARKRGVGFGIVASGQQNVASRPAWVGAYAPKPQLNALPEDMEVPVDEVADILNEGASAVNEMLAQPEPPPAIAPTSSYRSRAATYRNGISRPALQVVDGPGSRTSVVDLGEIARADSRQLAPRDQVAQSNLRNWMGGHFGRAARS